MLVVLIETVLSSHFLINGMQYEVQNLKFPRRRCVECFFFHYNCLRLHFLIFFNEYQPFISSFNMGAFHI